MEPPADLLPTVDLFAGAGGLSLGARAAGADIRLAVDHDPPSCATLAANVENHGGVVLEADLRALSGENLRERAALADDQPLLVVGGAPCQPFSKAAYWTDAGEEARYRRERARGRKGRRPDPPTTIRPDERRTLVDEFFRLVLESRAEAFVFENVRSITHPRHRPVLDRLISEAENAGFATRLLSANAADFGVPQLRHRVFLLGARAARPEAPIATHQGPRGRDSDRLPYRPVGPSLAPYAGDEFFEKEEVVEGRWAEHLRTVPPGWNYKAHTAWAGHPEPTFETETRFWNFLLKLDPARPSWTINASPGPWVGPFHWDSRRLRVPELAAIQGFPPGYEFAGPRRERIRQIGNAVPVELARLMVSSVLEAMGQPVVRQDLAAAC